MVYFINQFKNSMNMKNLKTPLYFLIITCCYPFGDLFSQDLSVKETAYHAYLSNSKTLWEKAVSLQQSIYNETSEDKDQLYELVLAQYGLLNSTMASKDEATFDEHVDKTVENVESLMDNHKGWSEPKAILSAIYGLKMAYSPWKGMFLGSKSSNLVDKAVKQDKNSALSWKIYGNSKLFTPEMWGGDSKEAVKALEKSIALFESDKAGLKSNWLYLDTMSFLGQAYVKTKQPHKAIQIYEKALSIEPDFNWVKFSLLPQAKKLTN